MKRFFNLSGFLWCMGLFSNALYPAPIQGALISQAISPTNNQASGQVNQVTPENRLPLSSALLQDEGPIADDRYTVDYTFSAQAGETVVVYWEALGSKVTLHDSTEQAIAPQPYTLANFELQEKSSHHVAFRLLTTGEHRLSFFINGYDNHSAQVKDPRYFIRVRPALEAERLMAEATSLSAEYRDNSVPSLVEAAWPLVNSVIEQSPQHPQPYLLRVRLAAQLASSRGEFDGYSGQSWQTILYDVFRAQPLDMQALIIADLQTAASNYEALAVLDDGFFAVPVDPELLKQAVLLLETGVPSAYLEDAFFNAILPTLIF